MDRRKFLTYVGCGCCGFVLNGCSTAPITDRRQLKIIPEAKLNAQAAQIYEKVKKKEKLSGDTKKLDEIKEIGKKILKLIDDLFKRIPFLRTVYSAILQMTETFSNKDSDKKSVVLIEYPRKGVWAVGFATKENTGEMALKTNQKLINVFVPTTPNPTSGFLLMFPLDEVIYLNMTFEEASKFIVSAGTSSGKN